MSGQVEDLSRDQVLGRVKTLSAAHIAVYVRRYGETFLDELADTGNFHWSKDDEVRRILIEFKDEDDEWKEAVAANTPQALRDFMGKYPNSEHNGDAKKRISKMVAGEEDNRWKKAKAAGTTQALIEFLGDYPDSARKAEAENLIAQLTAKEEDSAWQNAVAAQTIEALIDFSKYYPNSKYKGEADGRVAQLISDKEEDAWRDAYEENTIDALKNFIDKYQTSKYRSQADRLITHKIIKEYAPDMVLDEFGESFLRKLCRDNGLDFERVRGYDEPELGNGLMPKSVNEIPSEHIDVFFWGIPSSGKTCALAAILNAMETYYVVDDPEIDTQYGASYRRSLSGLLRHETGYLPAATYVDRTQYMPFRLKKEVKDDYRDISFFELSGEVFQHFYDIVYHGAPTQYIPRSDEGERTGTQEREHKKRYAFNSLLMFLKSKNKKIHFFFIDYNQAVQKKRGNDLDQKDYLAAATTYFSKFNDIFANDTLAAYIIVTKADQIKANNDEERLNLARQFLYRHFKAFVGVIQTLCDRHNVVYGEKIFSVGDVFFYKICKTNPQYSIDIVETLLDMIKPKRKPTIFDSMKDKLKS
jgi:outer membrane protein assembly factor BamD (BamD/ComL family)